MRKKRISKCKKRLTSTLKVARDFPPTPFHGPYNEINVNHIGNSGRD